MQHHHLLFLFSLLYLLFHPTFSHLNLPLSTIQIPETFSVTHTPYHNSPLSPLSVCINSLYTLVAIVTDLFPPNGVYRSSYILPGNDHTEVEVWGPRASDGQPVELEVGVWGIVKVVQGLVESGEWGRGRWDLWEENGLVRGGKKVLTQVGEVIVDRARTRVRGAGIGRREVGGQVPQFVMKGQDGRKVEMVVFTDESDGGDDDDGMTGDESQDEHVHTKRDNSTGLDPSDTSSLHARALDGDDDSTKLSLRVHFKPADSPRFPFSNVYLTLLEALFRLSVRHLADDVDRMTVSWADALLAAGGYPILKMETNDREPVDGQEEREFPVSWGMMAMAALGEWMARQDGEWMRGCKFRVLEGGMVVGKGSFGW